MTNYFNPVKITFTNQWVDELLSQVDKLNLKNPIIITSPGNYKRQNLNSVLKDFSVYLSGTINPTIDDCYKVISFCENKQFDSVVSIGGGSVMDLSKVVMSYLALGINDPKGLINYKKNYTKIIPSIFIPTTHGTASEVTMWGTIWDINEKKKYSIANQGLYPILAIIDGEISKSLPLDISISTTLDAISHSFESIWNKNRNPTSDSYAIKALNILIKNCKKIKDNPNDINIRNELMKAATTAGLAFSNTKTAAAHSISYPLTIHFDIPHGIAASMSLLPLLRINKKMIEDPLKIFYELSGFSYKEMIDEIKEIPKNIVRYNLNDWGVSKKDLIFLASESFTKGRMDNNIVDLNKKDVLNILEEIF